MGKRKKKRKLNAPPSFVLDPPRITVLADLPLSTDETHLDSFGLPSRIGALFDVIRHPDTTTPLTAAIYGDWGSGKTTAMRWLQRMLFYWNKQGAADGEQPKVHVKTTWFDPWKYDSKLDVWRGLVSEVIIKSADIENVTLGEIKKAARDFGAFLGKSFVQTLAGLKLKLGAPGVAEAELSLESLKELLESYQATARPEKAFMNEFEDALRTWLQSTLGKNERMVLFIDDLDRCMPDIALEVLEALKLYLGIPNLIFVVGVDRKIIQELVVAHYTNLKLNPEKSKQYLAKMFQLEIDLAPTDLQVEEFLSTQLRKIEYWGDLEESEQNLFKRLVIDLGKSNPREIKRLVNSAIIEGSGAIIERRK